MLSILKLAHKVSNYKNFKAFCNQTSFQTTFSFFRNHPQTQYFRAFQKNQIEKQTKLSNLKLSNDNFILLFYHKETILSIYLQFFFTPPYYNNYAIKFIKFTISNIIQTVNFNHAYMSIFYCLTNQIFLIFLYPKMVDLFYTYTLYTLHKTPQSFHFYFLPDTKFIVNIFLLYQLTIKYFMRKLHTISSISKLTLDYNYKYFYILSTNKKILYA